MGLLDERLNTINRPQPITTNEQVGNPLDNIEYSPLKTTIDGEEYYQYDGDTLTGKNGESIRVPGYDAGEVSRLGSDGEFYLGSNIGETQNKQINKIIKDLKFNSFEDTGEKDQYGRELKELVNPQGIRLSDYLHSERVVTGSRWQDPMNSAHRTFGSYYDRINKVDGNLTVGDKARAIVEQILTPQDFQKEIIGSRGDTHEGLKEQQDYLRAEINKINLKLQKEKDPNKIKELKEELVAHQGALTSVVNTSPTAMFYLSNTPQQRKPGAWGELWNSAEKSFYMLENTAAGFSAWAGDLANSDSLKDWGDEWVAETQEDLMNAGYTTDMWSVRNPLDAARFIGNTIVQYGPQLGVIYGGALAGGAAGSFVPIVGNVAGAAIGATSTAFVLAVSSVYQDQPEGEKDPLTASGIAMAIALVDRLGLAKSMDIGKNAFTREGREDLLSKLDTKYNGKKSKKELEEIIDGETIEVLKEAGLSLQQASAKQLVAKKDFKDLVKRLGARAGIEGATEAVQEAIQAVGIAGTTSRELDYEKLFYTMIEAGTIGSIVGGAFAVPGELKLRDRVNRELWENTEETESERSIFSIAEQEARERNNGKKLSVNDRRIQIKSELIKNKSKLDLKEDTKNIPEGSRWLETLGLATNPKRALQNFRNFALSKVAKKDGTSNRFMQEFNAMIGTTFRIFGGNTVTAEQKGLHSRWSSLIKGEEQLMKDLNVDANGIYDLILKPESEIKTTLTEDQQNSLNELKTQLSLLSAQVAEEIKARKLGNEMQFKITEDFFFNPFHIDARAIDDNFKTLLMTGPGYTSPSTGARRTRSERKGIIRSRKVTEEEADAIIDAIETGRLSTEQRQILKKVGVFNNPAYNKYVSKNLRDNIDNVLDSLARDIAVTTRFGRKGEIVSYLLRRAKANGEITEEERMKFSMMTLDYLAMVRGDYRPIKNKRIRWAQDTALFASTLTYMDTNFFANMGEMTYGLIGLDRKQMWRYIKDTGVMFFKGLGTNINVLTKGKLSKGPKRLRDIDDIRAQRLVEAGILSPSADDISVLEGVNTQSRFYKKMTIILYKLNLVENQTMAIRAARAAASWDILSRLIGVVKQDRDRGFITPNGRWALDNLNYYGLDVDFLINTMVEIDESGGVLNEADVLNDADFLNNTLDHNTIEALRNQFQIGITNFTDEFSVRPEPGSSPRWLEDPHFALFTQFTRFISHLTANVIPRTWDNYIKKGPPGMSYNVYRSIVGAYFLAMLSQLMKDYMVYGERAPWLDDDEEDPDWFRTSEWRAAEYTGWFGTPGMVVEAVGEAMKQGSRMGLLENIVDTTVSQSPVLSTIYSEYNKGTENLSERIAKKTPFIGATKPSREAEEELLKKLFGE